MPMRTLAVQHNQLEYVGVFAQPALSLWGDGKAILDGLFRTFEGYHSGLNALRTIGEADAPATQGVAVSLGERGNYRFKFERIEASLFNFSDEQIAVFAQVLERGDKWVRRSVPGLVYKSHLFTYASHSALSEGTSKDYLRSLSTLQLKGIGQNLGSGVIFHADVPDRQWTVQLAIDHSLSITDGLYVQMYVFVAGDVVNYAETLSKGRNILDSSLEQLGLTFGTVG